MQQQVILQGITYDDIQRIFEQALAEAKPNKPNLIYFDVAYLYTFEPSDVPCIGKFTNRMREAQQGSRNPLQIEWHRMLERWYSGEKAMGIKPTKIVRTVDRVVNEFMIRIAAAMAGVDDVFVPFKFHAIGDGAEAGTTPSPGDTTLAGELDRIDVTQQKGGGAITTDGSTFMCIGNHDVFSPGGDMTEMGMFDAELPAEGQEEDDRMGDHSIFPDEVPHISGSDSVGGTIVVYMCSS